MVTVTALFGKAGEAGGVGKLCVVCFVCGVSTRRHGGQAGECDIYIVIKSREQVGPLGEILPFQPITDALDCGKHLFMAPPRVSILTERFTTLDSRPLFSTLASTLAFAS